MTVKTTSDVNSDVDALASEPDVITLSSGSVVRVEHLKTRGLFKLLKIVTRGGGPILLNADLNFNDVESFAGQFLAIVFMAIPEAEDEAIDFVRSMITPVDYIENAKSKTDIEHNRAVIEQLATDLADPEPDDTISIIERIVINEAPNIVALGKRLAAMLQTILPSLN